MEILKANLDIIAAKNRPLAERLGLYAGESVAVERAKSGGATFRMNGMLFHSAYNPEKEAASQAGEIISKKPDWVLLFGLGAGHLLKALVDMGAKNVLVYEPSMEILTGVLATVDLSAVLAAENVRLYGDTASFIIKMRELDGFDTLLSYSTTPYKTAFPQLLIDFTTKVNNAHTTNKVCIVTDIDSRETWVANYFENIKSLPQCRPIGSLAGAFKGVPMIIAGAGPSLQKNAHLLKEAKGKAIIVAAITAYKPLLNFGVVPDFIIASEKVDLPEYFTHGEEDRQTRLILAEVSHPGMFERDVKEKFVFFNPYINLSRAHAPLWGSSYLPSVGGSVTTAAFDMGVMFGCDPITLVGQDLCFGENSTHVPGGVYIAQDVKIDREKGSVSIEEDYVTLKDKAKSSFDLHWLKGLDGRPVPSKFDWVTFHQWFEHYVASLKKKGSTVRVINATEGGAYIEGMEHTTLRQVLDTYVKNDVQLDEIIGLAIASGNRPDLAALAASVDQMHKGLKEIGRIADAITREVSSLKREMGRGGQIAAAKMVAKVKRLEDELFLETEKSPFIWDTLMASICELKEYLRGESAAGSQGIEKDIEAVYQAYAKVSQASAKFIPSLRRAAYSIKGHLERKDAGAA